MSIFDKYDLLDVDESFSFPVLPTEGLVFICGSSGSGKTTILRDNNLIESPPVWHNSNAIYKHFETEEIAESSFISAGLRSIPTWKRPYHQLSNGEQHRADIARYIANQAPAIDEFSSVVDRNTAKALSVALSKHYKKTDIKRLVIASCHKDIAEWLQPDYIYDTDLRQWLPRRCLRPSIRLEIKPCRGEEIWPMFQKHHYLSGKLNKSANCWVGLYYGQPVAFASIISFPNANFKNGWREHRTVVLPEFQGMGIGTSLSDTVAQIVIDSGCRYFSKTSHPAMGEHREISNKWKPTTKNRKQRLDYSKHRKTKEDGHKMQHARRLCYSHEYVG